MDESAPVLADTRILRIEIDNTGQKRITNPNSKYVQKLKSKIECENRLEKLQRQKKEKKQLSKSFRPEERLDISGLPIGKFDVDMKDVIRKALMMRLGKPQDKAFLQHLSPLRAHKVRVAETHI